MTARGFFFSSDGRLRAPWRILFFLALVLALFVLTTLALQPVLAAADRYSGIEETSDAIAMTIALIAAHAIALRWIDRRPWSYVWLDRPAARPGLLGFGFVLGAAPIAAASLLLMSLGWLAVEPSAPGSWAMATLKVTAVLAAAALYEELFSRGYLLAAMADGMGMPLAVAVSSAAFGLLHLSNPGATAQPIILVTLAGIFLAVVLLATRSLYAAWAAHFAWNWVMAVPLHVAVSGVAVPRPGYQTIDAGPDWATGGPWGPEGGVFAAAAMLAGIGYLYVRRSRNQPS